MGIPQMVSGMSITWDGCNILINGIKPNLRDYHDEESAYYYDEQNGPIIEINGDVLTINGIPVNPSDYEIEEETAPREREAARRLARHEEVGRLITHSVLGVVFAVLAYCVAIGLSAGPPSVVE
ncbi:uncharacterized protein RSE6_13290 [Rhynchosporium secalis]|uniref:Uncharacterized protein n=1 Tax=Rhynchosporium secalis TaxID=38038 RepID=A0A1E1MSK2_RHYSE|nr:uncharacterized protein RSE6_13290 [Rhynchosporium secalis]